MLIGMDGNGRWQGTGRGIKKSRPKGAERDWLGWGIPPLFPVTQLLFVVLGGDVHGSVLRLYKDATYVLPDDAQGG